MNCTELALEVDVEENAPHWMGPELRSDFAQSFADTPKKAEPSAPFLVLAKHKIFSGHAPVHHTSQIGSKNWDMNMSQHGPWCAGS